MCEYNIIEGFKGVDVSNLTYRYNNSISSPESFPQIIKGFQELETIFYYKCFKYIVIKYNIFIIINL